MDKLNEFFTALWQSLLSVLKIILSSKLKTKLPEVAESDSVTGLVILGNGPSLNDTIAHSMSFLRSHHLLAVNFAACAEQFVMLRPRYYVLADPLFFTALSQPNIKKLWHVLNEEVDWRLTLLVPHKFRKTISAEGVTARNPHLDVAFYNLTPVEGFKWLENLAFSTGLGMPRPRNVLIPSIMLALGVGYKTIYIAGADHSWTRTLSVDDDNNVVSIQPHFYKDDDREVKRVNTEYMQYPLHQILYSFYIAFRSYFTIARYARHIKATIYNITPGSFIDAFPRLKV